MGKVMTRVVEKLGTAAADTSVRTGARVATLSGFPEGWDRDSKQGDVFWAMHSCWKCREGEKPCPNGSARNCEYPHARDD